MIANTKIININEFYLAGISVRTINQNGQSGKDIKALWDKFFGEGVYARFPNKVSDDYYCVYHDYETDHTGYYMATLGCKVSSLSQLPEGFTGITIPADKYEEYALSGKCPGNVLAAWEQIWNGGADRKYTFDFDVYTPNAANFEDTEAKIYLAVN